MNARLCFALFLAAAGTVFGSLSGPAPAARFMAEAGAAQGDACAAVMGADLGLPHTTITVAEEVTPPFTPPETFSSRGFTVEDVSFCRIAGVASPEPATGRASPSRGAAPASS